jgi:hypothetical protein
VPHETNPEISAGNFCRDKNLEPIQEEQIHEQRVGLVSRLSMMRIIARRTKAATVVA